MGGRRGPRCHRFAILLHFGCLPRRPTKQLQGTKLVSGESPTSLPPSWREPWGEPEDGQGSRGTLQSSSHTPQPASSSPLPLPSASQHSSKENAKVFWTFEPPPPIHAHTGITSSSNKTLRIYSDVKYTIVKPFSGLSRPLPTAAVSFSQGSNHAPPPSS